MDIITAFLVYIDADKFVQNKPYPNPHNETGNGFRYSSERICIIKKHGQLNTNEITNFQVLVKNSQIEPGLVKRSPTHTDQQGPDDIVAIGSAASEHDDLRYIAGQFLEYGWKWKPIPFNFNNVLPGTFWKLNKDTGKKELNTSAMLFRQPQLIAHFMYAYNKKAPNWFLKFVWNLTIKTNGFKGDTEDQDSWVLSWHLINAYKNSSFRTEKQDKICADWLVRFNKQWPSGMEELLTKYFGFPHILATTWRM